MDPLVFSFVSALIGPGYPGGDDPKIYIVVPRSRAYLADLLARAFEGRSDVEIILERRSGERRQGHQPVSFERRVADRRRPKREVVEVVVTALDRPARPPAGSS